MTACRWLALLALTAHLLLLVRPDASFLSRPYLEDAFYSLSVAHSLSEGLGVSVDGRQPTNGVQPLICFLDAPLFAAAGGDPALALRYTMLLQIVIMAAAAAAYGWFAATLTRRVDQRRPVFWFVLASVAWSYMLTNGMLNGLETGLSTGLVFAAAAYYNSRIAAHDGPAPIRRHAALGVILGVAVLARIDIAFLVASLLAWHLVRAHHAARRLGAAERRRAFGWTLVECLVIGGASVLVSSPWWVYNVATFGSLVPISGQAQQLLFPDPWRNVAATVRTLFDSLFVLVNTPRTVDAPAWTVLQVATLLAMTAAIVAVVGTERMRAVREQWSRRWDARAIVPVLLFGAALIVYYVFFFGAPHFIVRYLFPLRVLISIVVIGAVYQFLSTKGVAAVARRAVQTAIVIAAAASAFGMTWNFTDRNTNIYMVPARWIAEHTGPADTIGMFQSGTTGFLDRRVVNLDGKVNVGALRALQRGRMPEYIDSMDFEYLIDWPAFVDSVLADPVLRGRYRVVDTLDEDFVVWRRVR